MRYPLILFTIVLISVKLEMARADKRVSKTNVNSWRNLRNRRVLRVYHMFYICHETADLSENIHLSLSRLSICAFSKVNYGLKDRILSVSEIDDNPKI